jgi:hypothetical protein
MAPNNRQVISPTPVAVDTATPTMKVDITKPTIARSRITPRSWINLLALSESAASKTNKGKNKNNMSSDERVRLVAPLNQFSIGPLPSKGKVIPIAPIANPSAANITV